jgi:hypothetical protein
MDKAKESLDDDFCDGEICDGEICDGEIPASTFIRIGQSLDMPGEIDKEEPKVIPKRNLLNILSKKTSVIVKNSNQK